MIFLELIPKKSRFLRNTTNHKKTKSLMQQPDFLVAANLIHLVSDVVFEALDVFLVCATVDEVEKDA